MVTGGTANLTAAVTSLGAAVTITGGTLNLGANNAAVTTFTEGPNEGELADTGTLTVSGTTTLSGNAIMEGGSASLRQGNLVAQGPLIIALTGGNVVLDGGSPSSQAAKIDKLTARRRIDLNAYRCAEPHGGGCFVRCELR